MTLEERIEKSTTVMVKAIFPNTTNHYNTLFGGQAMQWMDETAFITATRFSRQKMVTVSTERIDFTEAIPSGKLVELVGRVKRVGRSSLQITVTLSIEDNMYSDNRPEAVKGEFNMVAVGENQRSVPIKY